MEDNLFKRSQAWAQMALARAEAFRQEPKTFDPGPLPGSITDYAPTGQIIEQAVAHLRESIPSGQRQRTEAAWEALRLVAPIHQEWLHKKGLQVE
jgi:hypothetical protein